MIRVSNQAMCELYTWMAHLSSDPAGLLDLSHSTNISTNSITGQLKRSNDKLSFLDALITKKVTIYFSLPEADPD